MPAAVEAPAPNPPTPGTLEEKPGLRRAREHCYTGSVTHWRRKMGISCVGPRRLGLVAMLCVSLSAGLIEGE